MNPFTLLIILPTLLVISALVYLANAAGINQMVAFQLLIGLSALLVLVCSVWRIAKKTEQYAWLHEHPSWVAYLGACRIQDCSTAEKPDLALFCANSR